MIDTQEWLESIELLRRHKTLVVTNGVFDILHVGHIRCLQEAKAQGDILIVLVNSNDSVKATKPNRPIVHQDERAEMLEALRCVDFVVIFDEPEPSAWLKALKPDVYCKGHDYTIDSVPEKALVESWGGKVVITGDPKDHSTTDIINKIQNVTILPPSSSAFYMGT